MKLFLAHKPSGINTHQAHPNDYALKEFYENQFSKNFWPCHRLDKGTSGAILFAEDAATAAEMAKAFESQKVQKTYYFISDKTKNIKLNQSLICQSKIEKKANTWISIECPASEANAITELQCIEVSSKHSLWQAKPKTGKAHQIRLHAQDIGYPILGDAEHGGSPYGVLCLHAFENKLEDSLDFKQKIIHQSPMPFYFKSIMQQEPILLQKMYIELDRRLRLYSPTAQWKDLSSSLRILHKLDGYLSCDKYESLLYFSVFKNIDENTMKCIKDFCAYLNIDQYYVRCMINRGQDPLAKEFIKSDTCPEQMICQEHVYKYLIKTNQGQSPGIFLDQSHNRKWVLQNSKNLKVLNLFCYTGVFSVAAAVGGASEVVSVDTSKNYLEWTRENFRLNQIPTESHRYICRDASSIAESFLKKQDYFDLIICDPPSFARNDKKLFKIQNDFVPMIHSLSQILKPSGKILFSSNYEDYTQQDFEKQLKSKFKISKTPIPNLDYEYSLDHRILKSFFIEK